MKINTNGILICWYVHWCKEWWVTFSVRTVVLSYCCSLKIKFRGTSVALIWFVSGIPVVSGQFNRYNRSKGAGGNVRHSRFLPCTKRLLTCAVLWEQKGCKLLNLQQFRKLNVISNWKRVNNNTLKNHSHFLFPNVTYKEEKERAHCLSLLEHVLHTTFLG